MKSVSAGSWDHKELRVPAWNLCHPLPHLLPDPVGQTKQGQKEATPRPARNQPVNRHSWRPWPQNSVDVVG